MNRIQKVVLVTRRLTLWSMAALFCTISLFGIAFARQGRFTLSWFSFGCGVLGGFVSLEQRLKTLADEDLDLFVASNWSVVVVPLFGGVFSLVLYLFFLSGIIQGHAFPAFTFPPFATPPTSADFLRFFRETWPASGPDLAKFGLWSFLAGFSERLVPKFLANAIADPGKDGDAGKDDQKDEPADSDQPASQDGAPGTSD